MAAKISCPKVLVQDNYKVVVNFPKSLRTRCGEFWTLCVEFWTLCGQLLLRGCRALLAGCRALLAGCGSFWLMVAAAIGCLCFLALFTLAYMWIPIITHYCHKPPGIVLENFSIRDMAVFQNNATSTLDSSWQVNSRFNATFSTWNKNKVARCFTTYRRMDVRVEYRGQIILQQQIPLGFSLKPRRSRPLSIEMKGDQFQLKKELGPVMEAELRSANISLDFYFDTRYLIADRRSKWEHHGCQVVARPPLESSRLGTMLKKDCYST